MGANKDQIALETSFVNDLGADSLDTVELVMEFEDAFDMNIPDDDAEIIQTVGDAIKNIRNGAPGGSNWSWCNNTIRAKQKSTLDIIV